MNEPERHKRNGDWMTQEQRAAKLTEIAYAREEGNRAQDTIDNLRKVLGTYRFEKDPTCNFFEGYRAAMTVIYNHGDL